MPIRGFAPLLACAFAMAAICAGQSAPKNRSAAHSGQKTFSSMCASCHGLDGRGSERAPNIAQGANAQTFSDQKLKQVISQGLPGTGMPAFRSLSPAGLTSLVAHLRVLQGKGTQASLPGDARNGRALFFGPAGCSSCHMFQGQGGFIGRDLSTYASSHKAAEIKQAISHQSREPDAPGRHLLVTTKSGSTFDGLVRNEDNFSVQLQGIDGTFHFIMKSDIERITTQPALMPARNADAMSDAEIDDLIKFLASSAKTSTAASEPDGNP